MGIRCQPASTATAGWFLIAHPTGLSIGVHLLNFYCVFRPLYWCTIIKESMPTSKAAGTYRLHGVGAAVLYGIVPGVVKVGGWFELLFVNSFGYAFQQRSDSLCHSTRHPLSGVFTKAIRKRAANAWIFLHGNYRHAGHPLYGYGWSSALIGIIMLGILGVYLFADLKRNIRLARH